MKKMVMIALVCILFAQPVHAAEITAPTVPEHAAQFMPSEPENLGEGLLEVLRDALMYFQPDLKEAAAVCFGVLAIIMIMSLMKQLPGSVPKAVNLAGTVAIAGTLLSSANSMIQLAVQTVGEISEYGKLLLPVMTTALAAQGHVTSSTALYTGTAVFDYLLSNLISRALSPMVFLYLALAVAQSALGEETLKKFRDTMKGVMVWVLKTILYVFTGYISITGVVSGTTDASVLKAAKLTISGVVPVVGGILSDASEAVLVGAGTVKNAVGLYGLFAIMAIVLGPFLKIGAHYLLLKITAGISDIFGNKQAGDLIQDFSAAMGMLLAMTGAVSLMLMISMVCFMKGAA